MNKKIPVISIGVGLSVIFTVVLFSGFSDSDHSQTLSKTKITDVIPNAVFGGGSGSWRTTNVADIKDDVVYTLEGTILEFGEPIEHADENNLAQASIPVKMSVDKLHKGNWSESTFTFYISAFVFLNPSQVTKGMDMTNVIENHMKMYPGQDYSEVEKIYNIFNHHDLFEINDKILVHISIETFEGHNYIYEKDENSLDPRYLLTLGPYSYYEIIDDLGFNVKYRDGISISSARTESLP